MTRIVVLTKEDMEWARTVGIARAESKNVGKSKFPHNEGRSNRDTHIYGARAELAFARGLGLTWPARIDVGRHQPDIDPSWEVRVTPLRVGSPMFVKVAINDLSGALVAPLSARVGAPTFEIMGFIKASYVQQHYPATDPGNRNNRAHFAPASILVPIEADFHIVCGFEKGSWGWRCAFCGATWP